MKLSPARRAELLNELRLRELFKDKAICRRYGISRRTLSRLQAEAFDPYADGIFRVRDQQLTQLEPDTVHVLVLNSNVETETDVSARFTETACP